MFFCSGCQVGQTAARFERNAGICPVFGFWDGDTGIFSSDGTGFVAQEPVVYFEAFDSFAAAKAFLLEYKANMRPSEKQVELAKQLEARHTKAVLTDTMLESPKLLAAFIDKWIKVPSDVDDGQPPSEKQLKIIESLTEQLGCGIDDTRTKTLKEASSYIDELMSASDTPPTEKQKDFAVQISEILSIDLKEDVLKSKRKTSAFIDKHLSAYRKKTGSGKKK